MYYYPLASSSALTENRARKPLSLQAGDEAPFLVWGRERDLASDRSIVLTEAVRAAIVRIYVPAVQEGCELDGKKEQDTHLSA